MIDEIGIHAAIFRLARGDIWWYECDEHVSVTWSPDTRIASVIQAVEACAARPRTLKFAVYGQRISLFSTRLTTSL